MNEKLSRPQFNQMDTTEKQTLMESLAARYNMTFLDLHTFDRWGQSCTTGIFKKDDREFVFVPGDTVTLDVYKRQQLGLLLGKVLPCRFRPLPEALPELRQRNTLLAPFDKLFGVIVTRAGFQCLFKISQSPALLIQIKVGVTHAEVDVYKRQLPSSF